VDHPDEWEHAMSSTRRRFLKTTTLGLAGSAVALGRAHGANERMIVALVGCGGMGNNHLRTLLTQKDVEVAYVCDPDRNRLAAAAKVVQANGRAPQAVSDMRRVFGDKQVNAVYIATPDHWHAPATLLALEAGKHVYVEKPCSHNIREGRLMIDAARRQRRVVQVGTQSRSREHILTAMQLLREGAIGDVLAVRVWNSQLRRNIGHAKPSEPPKQLDYDLWVGPVPMVPYQSNLLHGIWRWWHNFGTGDMGNDGVHDLDIGRWGLGVDTHPSTIAALGGKYFFDDDQQFPDTQTVIFEYPGDGRLGHKKQLIYEQRIWTPYKMEGYENGDAFYGTRGMLILGKEAGWRLYGPRNKEIKSMTGRPNLLAHQRNFFECIRTSARPAADIEINHLSTSLCHLGNIATRVGRVLHFDPMTEEIQNDKDAGPMVERSYRPGHWAAPRTRG
jgi:predicted dehydrogenase